jgi:hypothetical protein
MFGGIRFASERVAAPHPRLELVYRQFSLHSLPVSSGKGQIHRIFSHLASREGGGNALSPSAYGERAEANTALKPCLPRVRGGHLHSTVTIHPVGGR